jgi:hypothetical protein
MTKLMKTQSEFLQSLVHAAYQGVEPGFTPPLTPNDFIETFRDALPAIQAAVEAIAVRNPDGKMLEDTDVLWIKMGYDDERNFSIPIPTPSVRARIAPTVHIDGWEVDAYSHCALVTCKGEGRSAGPCVFWYQAS